MCLNMGYAYVFVLVCVHGRQRKVTLSLLFHSLNLELYVMHTLSATASRLEASKPQ